MKAYPLHDHNGKEIGQVTLRDDALPQAMMNGLRFTIEGLYYLNSKQFLSFAINPVAAKPS